MTEQQLQFRVGVFVITASMVAAALVFRFGEMRWVFEQTYPLAVHFSEAPGVSEGTPVRKNGISIGSVREVFFEETNGGVMVLVDIKQQYSLHKGSRPRLTRSLLGDATIEFTPGKGNEFVRPGDRLEGEPPSDPLQMVERMERTMTTTLESFAATSDEWRRLGANVNELVESQHGSLGQVVERAALALHEFTITMQNANVLLGDPKNQANLQATLAALPEMMEETRLTIQAVRGAVVKADASLDQISRATAPLAARSVSIATKLDGSVGQLEHLLAEMHQFSKTLNSEQGSLNQFVSDPHLYRNLNESAATLQLLLKKLDPVLQDMRVFADKVARHPEVIGVGGALRSSSGLK